jgi:glycosyltransferase involved in cell wall biosynthesis
MTAAKNEQQFIGRVMDAVINQVVRPLRWVIVSDGSTDGTDEIVMQRARKHEFIELTRRPVGEKRNFGAKVRALEFAARRLAEFPYEFIGNLDADVTFKPDYYARVLNEFGRDRLLGIAGGRLWDFDGRSFKAQRISPKSVAGPVQMFRRRCWEELGGYLALPGGGEDAVAEITARMRGWNVRLLPQIPVWHHRATGTAGQSWIRICWKGGRLEYAIGYHPLFHLARAVQRSLDYPWVIGSLVRSASYGWSCLRRFPRPVEADFVRFHRAEEMKKLKAAALTLLQRKAEFDDIGDER